MHDIAQFLARHPPFSELDPDDLEVIATRAEIEFFAAGSLIVPQGAATGGVRVVRRGAVEVLDDNRPIDLLGEGEVFGYAAMLSGLPATVGARAAEDTIVYRFDHDAVAHVFVRPEGLRFVVRELDAFDARRANASRYDDPTQRPVGSLLRRPPLLIDASTTIRDAAKRMVEIGASSTIVTLPDGTLGMVTDRDFRARVIAEGRAYDDPISAVMTSPAYTVTSDRLGSEVLLEMLDRGVRHFPVTGPDGAVIGVISDAELLAVEARTPFHLRSAIGRATSISGVQEIVRRIPDTFVALTDARIATRTINTTVAVVIDAAVRRLLELVVDQEGEPPAPFSWLALGAHARRECAPSSDLDSALVWRGDDSDPQIRQYVRRVARRVSDALEHAGLPPCAKGAVAYTPLFSRSLEAWQLAAASWMDDPDQEKALILVSVVADARPVWGVHEGAPLVEVFRDGRGNRHLLRGLARMALAHRPPTGFLRDIVVEHSGEHHGRLDIKQGGLLPIVDLARYAGIAAGVTTCATRDRLAAAAAGGVISEQDAQTLADAFELVSNLRLEHQVNQLRNGATPDDYLLPAALSPLTRTYLKDAFRAIARTQRSLISDVDLLLR
jgi:CBS domain-containing protein